MKPVMSGEWELEEAVLTFRPLADVVDDPGRGAAIRCRNDDGDVWEVRGHGAGDEITGQIVGSVLCDGQRGTTPLEKRLQIRHAAVVDVFVGRFEAPDFRIGGKGAFHVLMDEFLQVEAERSVTANDFIRADAGIGGDITIWVIQPHISRLVTNRELRALHRGLHETFGEGRCCLRMAEADAGKEEAETADHVSHAALRPQR